MSTAELAPSGLITRLFPCALQHWYSVRSHSALCRLDRQVARRNLRRRADETLHHFARRLQSHAGRDEWLLRAADWYVGYANAIYSGKKSPPVPPPLLRG